MREKLLRFPCFGLVLLGITFAIYAPALRGDLVWDDEYLVGENPFFRSPVFMLEVFRHYLFPDQFSVYYRPLQNWSYIFDYWLWNGQTFGYHCTNIVLHAGTGALLYLLLQRLISDVDAPSPHDRATAAAVSFIWTIHPIHTAAVAYVSGRADSLAALLAVSAWLGALESRRQLPTARKALLAMMAAVLAVLALCSKEIALVWLTLFTLHLLCFDRETPLRSKAATTGVVLGVLAVYWALRQLPVAREPGLSHASPFFDRIHLLLCALGDYFGMMLWPARLTMDRSLAQSFSVGSLRLAYLPWLGGIAIAVLAIGCASKQHGRKIRHLGAMWFVVGFLPISNLFPLNAPVAEHWIYAASIGFFIFCAGCSMALSTTRFWPVQVLVICTGLALGVRTWVRSGDWSTNERLFKSTIAAGSPSPRALCNLADVCGRRGDFAQQERMLRRALALSPAFAAARINLGICLLRQGRKEEAEACITLNKEETDAATQQLRQTWKAALHLARLRDESGNSTEALTLLRRARARNQGVWELVQYEVDLLSRMGNTAAALESATSFAEAHWWHRTAAFTVGYLRGDLGDHPGALAAFGAASRLDLYDPRPLAETARIHAAMGNSALAEEAQLNAIGRKSDRAESYVGLAAILLQAGREADARAAFVKANQLAAGAAHLGAGHN